MLIRTRCAIAPFKCSGRPITPESVTQIMTRWASLASAVEDAMQFKGDEVLVWSLSVSGGYHNPPEQPAFAHAYVELCKEAFQPHGAYLVNSRSATFQEVLVTLARAETNILADALVSKGMGQMSEEEVVAYIVETLRK